jgi:hypothetical protein
VAAIQDHAPDLGAQVAVHSYGPVQDADRSHAREVIRSALARSPVLLPPATLDLHLQTDPDWARPALARVTVVHEGHAIRVHADATTIADAANLLGLRLRRRLEELGGTARR